MADEISLDLIMPAERAALKDALPRLQSILDELDSLPIPPALLHGDLHTGNVAIRDGKIQFFDWTDAAVSHPFFDLDVVFTADDPAERKILENAYLLPWQQIYPAGEVQRAFRLARVVFGLYHAISYQYILNNLEESDRAEINMSHYFLRLVLSGLNNVS
jgi:aminoglycoside phosphotransferase (APT) family kinase protein